MRNAGLLIIILAVIGWWGYHRAHKPPVMQAESFSSFLPPKPPPKNTARTPNAAAPVAGPAAKAVEEAFQQHFPGKWDYLRQGDRVRSIMGNQISGYANNIEGAQKFAAEIAPLFGAPSESVAKSPVQVQESTFRRIYRIAQVSGDFKVYNGQIAIFYSRDKDMITMVNSDLEPIEKSLPAPQLTPDEIKFKIASSSLLVKDVSTVPVAYVVDRIAHPSYVAIAVENKETWELVVDGRSGEILHRHPRNPDEDQHPQ